MSFKRFLLGSAAAVLFAAPALAADLTYPVKAPVAVAPAFTWTGFYVGAHAGYGWGDISGLPGSSEDEETIYDGEEFSGGQGWDYRLNQYDGYWFESQTENPDGWFGGAQVGYNFQFSNNVVLGVEADASFGSLKGGGFGFGEDYSQKYYYYYAPNGEFDTPGGSQDIYDYYYGEVAFSTKVEAFGTVRGRLGYAIDRFLPYVTGGLAWGHVKTTASGYSEEGTEYVNYPTHNQGGIPNGSGNPYEIVDEFSGSQSKTSIGWTIGGGLEYALTDNWTIKAEYLYIDLGSETYSFATFEGDTVDLEYKTKIQTVKVGVNYKF